MKNIQTVIATILAVFALAGTTGSYFVTQYQVKQLTQNNITKVEFEALQKDVLRLEIELAKKPDSKLVVEQLKSINDKLKIYHGN